MFAIVLACVVVKSVFSCARLHSLNPSFLFSFSSEVLVSSLHLPSCLPRGETSSVYLQVLCSFWSKMASVRLPPPTGQKQSQYCFFPHKHIKMTWHDLKGRSSMSAIFVLKTFQPEREFRSCLTASFCASRGSPGSGWRTGLRDVPPLVPPSRPVERTAHTHRRLLTLPQHTPPAPSCTTSTGLVLIMISLFSYPV